jgi:hypothetical protein
MLKDVLPRQRSHFGHFIFAKILNQKGELSCPPPISTNNHLLLRKDPLKSNQKKHNKGNHRNSNRCFGSDGRNQRK